MIAFLRKYHLYITAVLLLYLIINIIKSIFNTSTFILLTVILAFIYSKNKKLFKKTIYKLIYL